MAATGELAGSGASPRSGATGSTALRQLDSVGEHCLAVIAWLLVGAGAAMVLGGAATMRDLFGTTPSIDWGLIALGGAQFAGVETIGLLVFALALTKGLVGAGAEGVRGLLLSIAGVAGALAVAAAYATEELVRRAPEQWGAGAGLALDPPSAPAQFLVRFGTAAPYWVAALLSVFVGWQALVSLRTAPGGGR